MINPNQHPAKGANILVIDDEPVLRLTFKHLLEAYGYRIWIAMNGREGLNLFRQHPIDLVITDIVMPELDGFATIEALRREAPELPIIAMSAAVDEATMARPLTEPSFCCIRKPVDEGMLIDLIRAILTPTPAADDIDSNHP